MFRSCSVLLILAVLLSCVDNDDSNSRTVNVENTDTYVLEQNVLSENVFDKANAKLEKQETSVIMEEQEVPAESDPASLSTQKLTLNSITHALVSQQQTASPFPFPLTHTDIKSFELKAPEISVSASSTEMAKGAVRPLIAIIMDDLGYQRWHTDTLLTLKQPITYAVIPQTPYAQIIATDIVKADQELMLHIPMEPLGERRWESGLNAGMTFDEFSNSLNSMLDAFPEVKGINNHGGSLLTQHNEKMHWLMAHIQSRGLYFVDSRTTATSIAADVALEYGVLHSSRDVFLDNDKAPSAIANQFELAKRIAAKHGSAVVIAHPYKETIEFLINTLNLNDLSDVEFVSVSTLLLRESKSDF